MGDTLLAHLRAFLQAHGLMSPEKRVVVAVSGGPDSLGLLHLLLRLCAEGGPALHVAHLDHGIRGRQSAEEAAAVAAIATTWGVPATVERRDVPALAQARREGLPAAARRARYAFLAEVALAQGAHAVAVAHQADDQAETVLLHVLRGAGPAGLRGMDAVVPWEQWAPQRQKAEGRRQKARSSTFLIRPLLATPRVEITAYCEAYKLRPTDDPSNRDEGYVRTRVRRLLADLAAENPQVVAALGRTALICADDHDFIQTQLDALWPSLAVESPDLIALNRAVLGDLHPSLQRYALRRAAALLGTVELSLAQIEAARTLMAYSGRRLQLGPDLRLEVEAERVVLALPGITLYPDAPQLAMAELPLAVPGRTSLGAGWSCLVQETPPETTDDWWVALDATVLNEPLSLRRRQPGDRFRPVGGPGSRKLQDFFVDQKLPRSLRDSWPILATPSAIVWVGGFRADSRFLATAQTQGTIWVGIVRHEIDTD